MRIFRRCVSSLLLVSYLASQLAALPHAHGAETSSEHRHDVRPHVHLSWAAHHSSAHDHDHGHSHSHPATPQHSHQAPVESGLSCSDHDADAIYVPLAVSATTRGGGIAKILSVTDANNLASCSPGLPSLAAHKKRGANPHPPDHSSSGRELILKLRTLRI